MLSEQILKLAHEQPELQKYLVPLLMRQSAQKEKSWERFLAEKYDGGKRKVPNPNPKTRDKYPQVTLFTAIKYPPTMKKVQKEYQLWLGPENPPESKSKFLPYSPPSWREWGSKFDYSSLKDSHRKALTRFSSGDYQALNGFLRDGKAFWMSGSYAERQEKFAADLDEAFATKAARLPSAIKVSREISDRHPLIKSLLEGTLKPGSVYEDKGLQATSLDKHFNWQGGYKLHIALPKGANALYLGHRDGDEAISQLPDQYEVTLPRNTKIRILSFNSKTRIIQCELAELTPKKSKLPV